MSTRQRSGFPRVFSFGPPPRPGPSSRYPHRRRIRWWNVLTTVANCCLLLFTLFVLLVGLVDIGHSFIYSNRASKIADLSITFGTYAAVVRPLDQSSPCCPRVLTRSPGSPRQIIFGLMLVITRTVANKRAIIAIPKGYIPTKSTDVPKVRPPPSPPRPLAPPPSKRPPESCRPPFSTESERAHPERVRARVHHHKGVAAERAQSGGVGTTRCVEEAPGRPVALRERAQRD